MSENITRRSFIKKVFILVIGAIGIVHIYKMLHGRKNTIKISANNKSITINKGNNLMDKKSNIFVSKNGTPEQNMAKVIEMMGGINSIIGKNDIVILKPNAQWWNQGTTNTNAMKGFIDHVLNIHGFKGEIIIAENHNCYELLNGCNIRGWTTKERNGDFNLNELVDHYQKRRIKNVTKYHWSNAGAYSKDESLKDKLLRPVKNLIKTRFNNLTSRMVSGPEEGDGYVWSDIEYSYGGKKTKMSYPVFTSKYSKITIDFKNGAWQNGKYTGQPVKFINFAVLNHHSKEFGVTSSVKNYLGIVDMTCGHNGAKPEGYYNFHHMGIPGLGGAVGTFMNEIRMADLNIVTAEWVGYASRTNTKLSARTKTILASTDPVALDYYGAKYVLYPLGGPTKHYNNPDDKEGPLRRYLELCKAQGIGTLNENKMIIRKYNYN